MLSRPWSSMGHLLRGASLLFRSPGLWPVAGAPLGLGLLGYVGLAVASFWLVVPRITEALSRWVPNGVGWATGSVAFAIVWLVLSAPVFLVLVCGLSIPAWEVLSRKVEQKVVGTVTAERVGVGVIAADGAARIMVALVGGTAALVLSFIGLAWIGALIIGLILVFDATAPACMRRQVPYWKQPGLVLRDPSFVGMWLAAAVVSYVPVLNLLAMPFFVCGGTLMVAQGRAKGDLARPEPVE
ncbi:MAG: hypothetical protein JSS66_13350 [Armatimonadetes bacterium]|nr:hypothetical protein [Armatimonadota bacterium]